MAGTPQERYRENLQHLQNPKVQAMLKVIRHAEGTDNPKGYNTRVGYTYFDDLSKKPGQKVFIKSIGDYSSAEGAYQFLNSTYDGLSKKLDLKDFSKQSQDIAAVELLRENGALYNILEDDFEGAVVKASPTWASLPNNKGRSNYKEQKVRNIESLKNIYLGNQSSQEQYLAGDPYKVEAPKAPNTQKVSYLADTSLFSNFEEGKAKNAQEELIQAQQQKNNENEFIQSLIKQTQVQFVDPEKDNSIQIEEQDMFQKGGRYIPQYQEAGHFKTTTGKQVIWGTPEYEKAYNRGEVITNKGVKSPITLQGGQLDEVVIQNNYKRGFWGKYRDKILEENKDAGLFGAILGTPISAVASLPQLAMMEGLTGKMQRPSEAMNIQNPYGAMAVDAVTDPANLVGAGILTKEKTLSRLTGLARSTEGNILPNVNKLNPFSGTGSFIKKVGNNVALVKDLIVDKNTTLNKNFIFDSKNKIYNQIEEGYKTLDKSLEQKINDLNSEEGKKRLINQEKEYLQDFYYDPKNVDLQKAATENANARIEELDNIKAFGNKNKEFAYNVDLNKVSKTGIIKPNIESVQYRYGIPTNNADYEYTADIIDNPSGSKMLPGKLTLGRGYEHSTPTAFHEINHALQRARTLKIDNELRSIVPDFKENLSYDDINAYTYFKLGSEGGEPSSFLAELRSQMQKDGFIKNTYDNVSPELIEKAKDFYSKNKSKKVFITASGLKGITNTRILDFSRATPENYKIISDAMNKLPTVAPIAGASYLATQGEPTFQQGGTYTDNEIAFLSEIAIKDNNGQWTNPGKITEINSNIITMKGVDTPLIGISKETGETKKMLPNKEYKFGKSTKNVIEIPLTEAEKDFLQEFQVGGLKNTYNR